MRILQKKCRTTRVKISADILAVVALMERSLDLERQVTNQEQALVEAERKLHVMSSTALSAQRKALAKVEEARKFHDELEEGEGNDILSARRDAAARFPKRQTRLGRVDRRTR